MNDFEADLGPSTAYKLVSKAVSVLARQTSSHERTLDRVLSRRYRIVRHSSSITSRVVGGLFYICERVAIEPLFFFIHKLNFCLSFVRASARGQLFRIATQLTEHCFYEISHILLCRPKHRIGLSSRQLRIYWQR